MAQVPVDRAVGVYVQVTNAGARRGTEVVQLYVRDPVASVTRPVRELKAFRRVELEPGETRTVRFVLHASQRYKSWHLQAITQIDARHAVRISEVGVNCVERQRTVHRERR